MQASMFAELKARKAGDTNAANAGSGSKPIVNPAAAAAAAASAASAATKSKASFTSKPYKSTPLSSTSTYEYRDDLKAFLFVSQEESPMKDFDPFLREEDSTASSTTIVVPLAPCAYRMADYTFAKQEPVLLHRILLKLGVLRSLQRELKILNDFLQNRIQRKDALEDTELQKTRFMELVSNCGVAQALSSLLLKETAKASVSGSTAPQVIVEGLDDFLQEVEKQTPALEKARQEIHQTQTVSFFPGLGELFSPGSKLICHPDGMEGLPLGLSSVQCWYSEDLNPATNTMKRRFVLVMEFIVSVGDELVFVACTDVYPEFHDPNRNVPIKELTHRKLDIENSLDDQQLLQRLQQRGMFYASTATSNHYLEYYPDSFFPILQGRGFANNAVRPLAKGGRVMVDVKRGILETHIPVRSSDGYGDTVKEAIKLYESSKRSGVPVPFRNCHLPEFQSAGKITTSTNNTSIVNNTESDYDRLWMAWPLLVGFSFTSRVWGKLLLGLPKVTPMQTKTIESSTPMISPSSINPPLSPRRRKIAVQRPSQRKIGGVAVAGLGGNGNCSTAGYIQFQTQAFDQLVLEESKKELIRAVARNGGQSKWDDDGDEDEDDDDDDELDELGIDVVANKGGASIFLLHGPPGCGKVRLHCFC